MDKGKIAEFDSPTALKSIEGKKNPNTGLFF